MVEYINVRVGQERISDRMGTVPNTSFISSLGAWAPKVDLITKVNYRRANFFLCGFFFHSIF